MEKSYFSFPVISTEAKRNGEIFYSLRSLDKLEMTERALPYSLSFRLPSEIRGPPLGAGQAPGSGVEKSFPSVISTEAKRSGEIFYSLRSLDKLEMTGTRIKFPLFEGGSGRDVFLRSKQ